MNSVTTQRIAWVSLFLTLLHTWSATRVRAQASVPDRGEGTLTLTYENYEVVGHFDAQGHANNNGGTRSHALVAEFDYGLFERIGLLVSVPFIASKYTGPSRTSSDRSSPTRVRSTTGRTTRRFSDLRLELRRQWWAGPVAVTPLVGRIVPDARLRNGRRSGSRPAPLGSAGRRERWRRSRSPGARLVRPPPLRVRQNAGSEQLPVHAEQYRPRGGDCRDVSPGRSRARQLADSNTRARRSCNWRPTG